VKIQYSRIVYPEKYVNTVQPVTASITYNLPLTKSRLPKNMTRDPLSEFFLNKRTRIYARGLQSVYPQKRFLVFLTIKIQDPPTFYPK
jgi:hypothetical protein